MQPPQPLRERDAPTARRFLRPGSGRPHIGCEWAESAPRRTGRTPAFGVNFIEGPASAHHPIHVMAQRGPLHTGGGHHPVSAAVIVMSMLKNSNVNDVFAQPRAITTTMRRRWPSRLQCSLRHWKESALGWASLHLLGCVQLVGPATRTRGSSGSALIWSPRSRHRMSMIRRTTVMAARSPAMASGHIDDWS